MREGVAGLTRDKTRKTGKPALPAAITYRIFRTFRIDGFF